MALRAGLQAGLLNQSSAQVIDGSLKFDRSSSQHLSKTFSLGNRRTWTWSCWCRQHNQSVILPFLSNTTGGDDINYNGFFFNADQTLGFNGWNTQFRKTTAVHRDTGWYNIVVAFDTTQSTALDRIKYYINGVLQTDFAANNAFTENGEYAINKAETHHLGRLTTAYAAGQMSQVYFIDGQQLGPENFGFTDPLTNTWRPKKFDIRAEVAKNPNNGTTWDSTNTTAYDGGVQNDSVTGTSTFTGVNGNFTSTLSQSVEVRNHLRLQMYASTSAFDTYCDIQVNGSGEQTVTVHESQGSESGIYDVNFTGTLSSIKVTAKGGANIGLAQVIVDDYVLINGAKNNSFYLPMDGSAPIGHDKLNPKPINNGTVWSNACLLYTSPSPRDKRQSRMPSSA